MTSRPKAKAWTGSAEAGRPGCGLADATGDREVMAGHDPLQHGGGGAPPLLLGQAGVALRAGQAGVAAGDALDVGEDQGEHRVHLQVGQADAVEHPQLGLVLEDRVRAEGRAAAGGVERPGVAQADVPVALGDVAQPSRQPPGPAGSSTPV